MKNLKSYLQNTVGNFSILAAAGLGALTLAAAVAIDISSLQSSHSSLQDIADSATLTAAIAANKKNINGSPVDRLAVTRDLLAAHSANLDPQIKLSDPIITFNDETQEVTIELVATRKMFFSGVLGQAEKPIGVSSAASYEVAEVNPVSLAFVVDVSGSMGWCPGQNGPDATCPEGQQPRLNTLKQSVGILFDQIENGNTNIAELRDKVRTGMWTYRNVESASTDMADGWNHVETFINGLTATGGTHSTDAFESAFLALQNEASRITHPNHKRFIVFMTDGANNDVDSTLDTERFCIRAKEDGINIFSVAFSAPIEGENLLLQCASPNDDEEVSDPGEFEYDEEEETIDNECDFYTDPNDGNSSGRRRCERNKNENYFDASNEDEFKEAFAQIGAELGRLNTRLTQ